MVPFLLIFLPPLIHFLSEKNPTAPIPGGTREVDIFDLFLVAADETMNDTLILYRATNMTGSSRLKISTRIRGQGFIYFFI